MHYYKVHPPGISHTTHWCSITLKIRPGDVLLLSRITVVSLYYSQP